MAQSQICPAIASLSQKSPKAKKADQLIKLVKHEVDSRFNEATQALEDALAEFQKTRPGDLDTALKNEEFARLVTKKLDEVAKSGD